MRFQNYDCYALIHFNVCRFVGKGIQKELLRKLHGTVTRPVFVTFSAKVWDELDLTPDTIERSNQAPPCVVAPVSAYEDIHIKIWVSHAP